MRIFLILTLLISIQSFGQDSYRGDSKIGKFIFYYGQYGVPTNYQYRVVRERSIAAMFDSSLHVPRYNGTPVGLRTGSSTNDGLIAVDTLNHLFYYYSGGAWIQAGSSSTLQEVFDEETGEALQDKNDTINNGAYRFNIRSLTTNASIGGVQILQNDGTSKYGYINVLPNNIVLDAEDVNKNTQIVMAGSGVTGVSLHALDNAGRTKSLDLKVYPDSLYIHPNPTDLFNFIVEGLPNKSIGGTDSVLIQDANDKIWKVPTSAVGGSGTINSGTTGKPAYYVGATTLDDFAAVDYATSGTNVLITTQNTTDVGLNIKGQSSQSANYLNISSSAGTGDLAFINASGEMIFGGNTDAGVYDLQINDGLWVNNVSAAAGNGLVLSPSTTISSGFVIQNNGGGEWIMAALNATSLKMFTSSSPIYISPGGTDKAIFLSGGGMTQPEQSAPSTPASGHTVIYPKSDGLIYGKDDAGVETKLSNPSLNKGAFIALPTSADTVDVWQTPVAITITSLKAVLRGTTPSVTYNIGFGTSIQSPTAVFTSDITCTSITTGCSNSSGFNDATIPAGSFIWIYTNAASGTIRSIAFTINYTED